MQRPLQHRNLLPATKDTDDPPVSVARPHYQERKSGVTVSLFRTQENQTKRNYGGKIKAESENNQRQKTPSSRPQTQNQNPSRDSKTDKLPDKQMMQY